MLPSIPRPEHPRPDFMRPQWLNLNGQWQFCFDDADLGLAQGWQDPAKSFRRKSPYPSATSAAAAASMTGRIIL